LTPGRFRRIRGQPAWLGRCSAIQRATSRRRHTFPMRRTTTGSGKPLLVVITLARCREMPPSMSRISATPTRSTTLTLDVNTCYAANNGARRGHVTLTCDYGNRHHGWMPGLNASPVFDRSPVLLNHRPIRPLWHCRRGCGVWPCPTARLCLRASYERDPVGLAVYMADCLFDAAGDLAKLDPNGMPGPDALFYRFVGWTRRRPLG
jgi:hypothetical protein